MQSTLGGGKSIEKRIVTGGRYGLFVALDVPLGRREQHFAEAAHTALKQRLQILMCGDSLAGMGRISKSGDVIGA